MENYNDCRDYELLPDNADPTSFQNSTSLYSTNFTNIGNPFFDIYPHSMSYNFPTTPSNHPTGRGIYPDLPAYLVTPHGQLGRPINYPYYHTNNSMSLQQTPAGSSHPPMMYSDIATSGMHATAPVAQVFDGSSYNGENHAFSDSTENYASTPTSKPSGMLTPTASPQSPASDLPAVPLSQLRYNSFEEAEAASSGRIPLQIGDDDDWESMEANKKIHVATIMAAFDVAFRRTPNVALTDTEKVRWVKYQTEQNEKVTKYIAKEPRAKEVAAWMLLEALIDTHKLGCKKGFRVADADKRCSQRFTQMVLAIGRYAVIRFDVVRLLRIDELATSPSLSVTRKIANWRGNAGKVKRDEENKELAAAKGVEYKTVLGDKRKLKPLEPALVQDQEDDFSMDTPTSMISGTKRKAHYDGDDGDFDPSSSPSKNGRKTATPASKRTKRATVVAGPDADM
ncbi:uncharacterized protein RCC_06395 [Ramularia collo-cygni]|uniref:Uncharacterized protein n=1 Tax=Ramularia collo-cygni TaxID=112498 RepID=A0A2D3V722_9PEZI|nr:uncharacterized protein RCC_06395 [Ramularia collo-cygni]CZT20537.1 uncharacterized protein RCC_06395 [Ramularia collo-cygni]